MVTDRRTVIAGMVAGLVGPGAAQAQDVPEVSLGAVAAQVGVTFGTAFDREILTDEPYRRLVAREARIGTIANSLKFDWLRPRGPTADFGVADELVAFCARNGMAAHGAALFWNDWPPPWLPRTSARERAGIMDRHVDEVLGRYRGRVASWDVINEPFYPPLRREGGFRPGPWFDAMGKAHIFRAFRRARTADPAAKLVLNEAFCEQNDDLGTSIRPRLLCLVDEMREGGVPLDVVGFQAHLKPHLPYDDRAFRDYLHEMARRNVEIWITELDVDDSHLPDDPATRDRLVAARHRDFLTAVLEVPAVKVVVTWHLADKYSWYAEVPWYADHVRRAGGTAGRRPRSHMYDDALAPKAARNAVRDALLTRARRAP